MQAKVIIHLDNLYKNIQAARKKAGPAVKLCVPLKADAYGHGAIPVSRAALEAGAEYLAVAGVQEAAELRDAGISAPVLLFSQALPEELPYIVSQELIPLVSDGEFIEEAAAAAKNAGKPLRLHLKVDTGMGRLGCRSEEAAALAGKIAACDWLSLDGLATHLAVSDSTRPEDLAYTKEQLRRFREVVSSIKDAGIKPGLVHAANSGGLVFHEDSHLDMIRPGIFLYGYSPDPEFPAEPVMELRSKVVNIKKIKKGESVSYGRTWHAAEDTFVGVLPLGYAAGFPRALSNNHSVRIRGRDYPLVGRVCMEHCLVNLGPNHGSLETDVRRWDEAVIFGPGFINAADMAAKLGTISYEITCNINKHLPREFSS
ncbi:MAG: alanine racemase [Treponema sp.]|nr:alanine racemase [Treponema sp.]